MGRAQRWSFYQLSSVEAMRTAALADALEGLKAAPRMLTMRTRRESGVDSTGVDALDARQRCETAGRGVPGACESKQIKRLERLTTGY